MPKRAVWCVILAASRIGTMVLLVREIPDALLPSLAGMTKEQHAY